MPRVKKPKLVSITRPVFELYTNKFEMMKDPKKMFSTNDNYKSIDYLIKTEDSMLQSNIMVNLNKNGTVKESELKHLLEIEAIEGFYGWIKSMHFETYEYLEEPKPKKEKEEKIKNSKKK